MFARIVPRYDLMNRLMTLGRDDAWRRATVAAVKPGQGLRALDLGCGTGDLTLALRRAGAIAIALDPVVDMLEAARAKLLPRGAASPLLVGDATDLPFRAGSFDVVVSAFVMRNVADLPRALRETRRVLRPGGRVGILELTPVTMPIVAPIFRLYFHHVVPRLGALITGDRHAYTYLPASVDRFPTANALAGMLAEAGFERIRYRRLMFATVALHVADRSENAP
jgi:demethylmenaquinone methyltransferase/2-methoxy-6-polyprenyl-1,4-benzoquinol methylase